MKILCDNVKPITGLRDAVQEIDALYDVVQLKICQTERSTTDEQNVKV